MAELDNYFIKFAIFTQVTIKYESLAVSVKVPSRKYGGKMEGLCGDCNNNRKNDLTLSNGDITTDSDKFVSNWLHTELGISPEACLPPPPPVCEGLSPDEDPCRQILEYETFREVTYI